MADRGKDALHNGKDMANNGEVGLGNGMNMVTNGEVEDDKGSINRELPNTRILGA